MSKNDYSLKSISDLIMSDLAHRQNGTNADGISFLEIACITKDALPIVAQHIYTNLAENVLDIVKSVHDDAELITENKSVFSNDEGPIWWRRQCWPGPTRTGFSFETKTLKKPYVGIFMVSEYNIKNDWPGHGYKLKDSVKDAVFNSISTGNQEDDNTAPGFPSYKYASKIQDGLAAESLLMAASLKPFQGDQFLADWIAEQTLAYAKSIDKALGQA